MFAYLLSYNRLCAYLLSSRRWQVRRECMKLLRRFLIYLANGCNNISAVPLLITCCQVPNMGPACVHSDIRADHYLQSCCRDFLILCFPLLPGVPAAPAHIADKEAGKRVWRCVVPEGVPPQQDPPGMAMENIGRWGTPKRWWPWWGPHMSGASCASGNGSRVRASPSACKG